MFLVFHFLSSGKDQGFTTLHDLGMSGQDCLWFRLERYLLKLEGADWRCVISTELALGGAMTNDTLSEQRTIQDDALVLATLTADVEAELSRQVSERGLKLRYRLAEMVLFETHGASLDDPRVQFAVDHFLQEGVLVAQPQIRETDQAESLAHVFDPQSLVVAEYGSTRHCLHLRVSLLHLNQQREQILNFIGR